MSRYLRTSLPVGLAACLLGILGAFFVWSLLRALDSRQELSFDIPGEIHVLKMVEDPQRPTIPAAAAASAQDRLASYLRAESLVLVATSPGEGPPELRVFDPRGALDWLPRDAADTLATSSGNAYLFHHTYSAQRWVNSSASPLLPKGMTVGGVIAAPPGVIGLQYATGINQGPLRSGTYTFSTLEPQQLAQISGLLAETGLVAQSSNVIPLVEYLTHNPLLAMTAVFVLLGQVCAVLSWVLQLRRRNREFQIRRRHGARGRSLLAQNVLTALPALVFGTSLGVVSSALLVAGVGQVPLTARDVQALAGAAAASTIVVVASWSTTLGVVMWSRGEARRVV